MKEEMKTLKKDIKIMEHRAKDSEVNLTREIAETRLEGRRGYDRLAETMLQGQQVAKSQAEAQTEMMQQILMRLNQVPLGHMSQSAPQMLHSSQVSPGYMTQPAQEKEDIEMSPVLTLKRSSSALGAPAGKCVVKGSGKGKGAGRGMDTEFKITMILHGVELKEEVFIVTSDLTLAILKDKLIGNMRSMNYPYEFVSSYYSGPQPELYGDQHTMQDMSLQEGSTLQVYLISPERPIINRPLSLKEKSLTIKFPDNPAGNSASNIGISGEDILTTISEKPKLVKKEAAEEKKAAEEEKKAVEEKKKAVEEKKKEAEEKKAAEEKKKAAEEKKPVEDKKAVEEKKQA
jgi:hypothetical protein